MTLRLAKHPPLAAFAFGIALVGIGEGRAMAQTLPVHCLDLLKAAMAEEHFTYSASLTSQAKQSVCSGSFEQKTREKGVNIEVAYRGLGVSGSSEHRDFQSFKQWLCASSSASVSETVASSVARTSISDNALKAYTACTQQTSFSWVLDQPVTSLRSDFIWTLRWQRPAPGVPIPTVTIVSHPQGAIQCGGPETFREAADNVYTCTRSGREGAWLIGRTPLGDISVRVPPLPTPCTPAAFTLTVPSTGLFPLNVSAVVEPQTEYRVDIAGEVTSSIGDGECRPATPAWGRDLILSGNACRHWNPELIVGEERRQAAGERVPRMSIPARRTACPRRSRSPTA